MRIVAAIASTTACICGGVGGVEQVGAEPGQPVPAADGGDVLLPLAALGPPLRLLGVRSDQRAADPVGQRGRSDALADPPQPLPGDVVDHVIVEPAAGGPLAVRERIDQHLAAPDVDHPVGQRLPHLGQLLDQHPRLVHQHRGGPDPDAQHHGDLVGHPVIGPVRVGRVTGAGAGERFLRRLQRGQPGDGGGLQGVQLRLGLGDVPQHRVHPGPVGVGGDQQLGQPRRPAAGIGREEPGSDLGDPLGLQHRSPGRGGGEHLDLPDTHRQPEPDPDRCVLHRDHPV